MMRANSRRRQPRSWTLGVGLALALHAGSALAQAVPPVSRVGVDEQIGAELPAGLTLKDHLGRTRKLGEFLDGDKPLLLVLAYYHCPGLCDISLRELAGGVRNLGWTPGDEFRALTVSIDPSDTALSASAKRQSVLALLRMNDSPAWGFAVASRDEIARLTQRIGYRYEYDEQSKQYAHPPANVVLTPQGKVARYLYGPTVDSQDLRLALREARLGRGGPTDLVDRVVLSCFQYDPVTRRYEPLILGVMRIGSALVALVLALSIWIFVRKGRSRRSKSSGAQQAASP